MKRAGYNPWANALVWYAENPDSVWGKGTVLKNKVSNETGEWIFTIECNDKDDRILEIRTTPVDFFCLEFNLIKKRGSDESNVLNISDMTSLSFLNEPEMIECLRIRYSYKTIYTSIGPILIAVNPFESLGSSVYSSEAIGKYFDADQVQMKQLGPHIYQISNNAYTRMLVDKYNPNSRENQTILVNGESGAGKTESTKHVMRFLAANSSKLAAELTDGILVNDIESLINAVNPITESFGNAKTSRNNNSSRFGKFIELCYSTDGYIDGAHIQTYLLETIRVTSQIAGERNFHVFYEVFAGMTQEQKTAWNCPSLDAFRFVNQSGEFDRHDGESDLDNFHRLLDALKIIAVPTERIEEIWRLVIGILHIGNLTFDFSDTVGEDAAVFSSASKLHVDSICELFGIGETALLSAMAKRSIKVAGNVIEKNLNPEAAGNARDVCARTSYDLLFRSLLQEVNRALSIDESQEEAVSFIGVLDIFGFEYFESNSFEQLCINYANEKLQDHFNYAIFKSEQEVYEDEGIKWTFKDYPDNSERLELFEHKRTGMFMLCDEQLKIPKPEDDKLVKSFYAKCDSHRFFSASRGEKGRYEFVVHHFACDVRYNIAGFVDKNRNEIASEIYYAFESSSSSFVQSMPYATEDRNAKRVIKESEIYRADSADAGNLSHGFSRGHVGQSVGRKTTSVASLFSHQLNQLIAKIRGTRSHFVRCIKPNNDLLPRSFDYGMVMSQLRCGGALGAVQVFHAGFPNRMDFKYFVCRYSAFLVVCGVNALSKDLQECITRARQSDSDELWRISSSMLVDIVSLTAIVLNMTEEAELAEDVDLLNGLQRGKTQVFLRAPVFELLERLHARSMNLIAKRLQRRFQEARFRHSKNRPSARSAAANSVMYIAFKRRDQARKCVSAILVLQRRVRVFLAVCKRRKMINGFTLLAALFRGTRARALVKNIKYKASVKIQNMYRAYRTRKWYTRLLQTSIRVQAFIRSWRARNTHAKLVYLARTLQRLWRGTKGRMQMSYYRQKRQHAAAEAKLKEAQAKEEFMANIGERLRKNPNLLSDLMGAMDRIAELEKQNEVLMKSNRMLKVENKDLRKSVSRLSNELDQTQALLSRSTSVDALSPKNRGGSSASSARSIFKESPAISKTDASKSLKNTQPIEELRSVSPKLASAQHLKSNKSTRNSAGETTVPKTRPSSKRPVNPGAMTLPHTFSSTSRDAASRLISLLSELELHDDTIPEPISAIPVASRPGLPPSIALGNVRQWWQYAACKVIGKTSEPHREEKVFRSQKSSSSNFGENDHNDIEEQGKVFNRTDQGKPERRRIYVPEGSRSRGSRKSASEAQPLSSVRGETGLLLPSSAFAKYLSGGMTSSNLTPTEVEKPQSSDGSREAAPVSPIRSAVYNRQRSDTGMLIPSPELARYIKHPNRTSSL